jgi:hypothetical protein
MLKAADAFAAAGYDVRVISAGNMARESAFDARLQATGRWRWRELRYGRDAAPLRWFHTGARRTAAWTVAGSLGDSAPLGVVSRAIGRVHPELVDAILEHPADFIYGGGVGALAGVAAAARASATPFAIDFEDFHCGEREDRGDGARFNRMARRVMIDVARDAAFVTAGSAAIADACGTELCIQATAIHNVFPLPRTAPAERLRGGAPLRLYWFSQTIGPGRGLETVIEALALLDAPAALDLRGAAVPEYVTSLQQLAARVAPRLTVSLLDIAPPDQMVDACCDYDVGLSVEPGRVVNNALALSNKATTYILAGMPVAMTDTPGQRAFAADLGAGAIVFAPGDAAALAAGLRRLSADPLAFAAARRASWEAAQRRWHWEHRAERGALLDAVRGVLG